MASNKRLTPPKKILIRLPNWLGDCVMATPVIEMIAEHYPDASLTICCPAGFECLFETCPYVDDVITIQKPKGWWHRNRERKKLICQLREGSFNLGILLTNSFSSAWLFWRAHIEYVIGYANEYRSFFLNNSVPFPEKRNSQHLVTTYKQLLTPLGIPLNEKKPHLFVEDEDLKNARLLLKRYHINPDAKIVGINPSAAYGPAKCWLPERFREVTERLLTDPTIQVVYIGDNKGKSEINHMIQNLSPRVVSLAGLTTLRELISIMHLFKAFLTNDSGPMHLAAACNTPLVALFGSTSDIVTPPYKTGIIIHKHVECSPCYKRICPIDFRCMKRIHTDEVYESLLTLLNTKH